MRVAKIVVPPASIRAGEDAMAGRFTTQDVVDAVRAINEEVGLDPGEHTSEEYARLVADKIIGKALAANRIWSDGEGWRA